MRFVAVDRRRGRRRRRLVARLVDAHGARSRRAVVAIGVAARVAALAVLDAVARRHDAFLAPAESVDAVVVNSARFAVLHEAASSRRIASSTERALRLLFVGEAERVLGRLAGARRDARHCRVGSADTKSHARRRAARLVHDVGLVERGRARRLAVARAVAEACAVDRVAEALVASDASELVGARVAGAGGRRSVEQANLGLLVRQRHVGVRLALGQVATLRRRARGGHCFRDRGRELAARDMLVSHWPVAVQ